MDKCKSAQKKVMVFGTFDGLHPGHIDFLRQAKEFGDCLVAIVGRDTTVRNIKGKLPRRNENERLSEIKKSGAVDDALLGNLGDPYAVIGQINPDVIALGYDQNSFTANLESELKKASILAMIVRLKPFKPEVYHSRLINK